MTHDLKLNRRNTLLLLGLGAGGAMLPGGALAQATTRVNYMFAFPVLSYIVANQSSLPVRLGFFEEEGLSVAHELAGQGAAGAVLQMVARRNADIGSGTFDGVLLQAAAGNDLGLIFFYNQIRASHLSVITLPDSPINSIADLRGKTIGVQSLGGSPMKTVSLILREQGIDPSSDVTFVAVGIAAQALQAMRSGECDAYVASRGTVSGMEAVGAQFKFLDLPEWMREVTGAGLFTSRDYLQSNRQALVGIGRSVAKSTVFMKANPEAAVRIHWDIYPEQVPQGTSFDQAVTTAIAGLNRQLQVLEFQPHETVLKYGYTAPESSRRILQINEIDPDSVDIGRFYTNDLIDEINDFDIAEIEDMARNYRHG